MDTFTRKPGFTLLELLVTSVIFVVVVILSISIFSSTARFEKTAQRTQDLTSQSLIGLQSIKKAFLRSIGTVTIIPPTAQGGDDVLVLTTPEQDINGLQNGTNDQLLYCVSTETASARQLAVFTVSSAVSLPANPQLLACTNQGVQSLFSSSAVQGPSYLTDTTILLQRLHFSPVQYADNAPVTNMDALQIEATLVYDPTLGGTVEVRAADTVSKTAPQVLRSTVIRATYPTMTYGN
jgi:type II secretory pathway pseudopilin PulG